MILLAVFLLPIYLIDIKFFLSVFTNSLKSLTKSFCQSRNTIPLISSSNDSESDDSESSDTII